MKKELTSWHVDATIRLKKATFDFSAGMWHVEAYINFKGPNSNESIVSNEVIHKWFAFGDDIAALEKILADKCGADLLGPQKTLALLMKEH